MQLPKDRERAKEKNRGCSFRFQRPDWIGREDTGDPAPRGLNETDRTRRLMSTHKRRAADLASPSTDPPPERLFRLRPLTKVRTKGPRAGETYARENPQIEIDIREGLRLGPVALAERMAEIDYPSLQTLASLPEGAFLPEALVYLYRHHWSAATEAFDARKFVVAKTHRDAAAAVGEAIDHVVARHLRRKLSQLTDSKRIDAEEEVRDQVSDALHDLSPQGDPLECFFGLVVMNLCKDAFNAFKERRHSRESDLSDDDTTLRERDRSPEDSAHLDSLQNLIDRLPDDRRIAFERRALNGEPYAALADELGVSERTIRKRKNKAIETLQTILSDDDRPDPDA